MDARRILGKVPMDIPLVVDLDEFHVHFALPWIWAPQGDGHNGPAVADPLTLRASLEIFAPDDDDPVWETTLRELAFEELIERNETGPGDWPRFTPDAVASISAFVTALRKLADDLEAELRSETRIYWVAEEEKK